MKVTSESKFFLGIIGVTIFLIGFAAYSLSKPAPPEPELPKGELVGESSYTRGNASASAYLVEFSDFQCPACKTAKPVVDELTVKYKNNLLFVYRHFPLAQHPFGTKAALAAEAAGEQGKFWEMYDLLFTNQENFSDEIFVDLARQLKLDEKAFSEALNDPKLKEKVAQDQNYGITIGINSTPTFFLNGRKLKLTSFLDIATQVERILK